MVETIPECTACRNELTYCNDELVVYIQEVASLKSLISAHNQSLFAVVIISLAFIVSLILLFHYKKLSIRIIKIQDSAESALAVDVPTSDSSSSHEMALQPAPQDSQESNIPSTVSNDLSDTQESKEIAPSAGVDANLKSVKSMLKRR